MNASDNDKICPYLDKECPRNLRTVEAITKLELKLNHIEKLTYIIAGMIAIEYGITLF